MKKTIVMMAGIAFCLYTATVNAQQTWEAKKNPTVDSINSKYDIKALPVRQAATIEQIYPALGQYESTVNVDAASVTIRPDEQSKGVVWVTGLPHGKLKAMLKKSPATYRIPPQTTEDGKMIAEGTLIYDKETNELHICIGKPFNEMDPASIFLPVPVETVDVADAVVKVKSDKIKIKSNKPVEPKPWMYAGTKIEKSTALNQ